MNFWNETLNFLPQQQMGQQQWRLTGAEALTMMQCVEGLHWTTTAATVTGQGQW